MNCFQVFLLLAAIHQCFGNWVLSGSAHNQDNFVRLTPGVGAAWWDQKFTTSLNGATYSNDGFEATIYIRGFNGSDEKADGMAFVLQNLNNFTIYGGGGGNMGVPPADPTLNQYARGFRFDWFAGFATDEAVWLEYFNDTNIATSAFNKTGLDTSFHKVFISYQHSTRTTAVLVDTFSSSVFHDNLYPPLNAATDVIVGVTAATGGFWMDYDIQNTFAITPKTIPTMKLFGLSTSSDTASTDGRVIRLVEFGYGVNGAAYKTDAYKINGGGARIADGYSMSLKFKAYAQYGTEKMADGFAFVVYNGPSITGAWNPAAGGGGMGVPANALGFKFDWWNTNNNVVLKYSNDTVIQTLDMTIAPYKDQWRTLTINYVDSTQTAKLSIADPSTGNTQQITLTGVNLFPTVTAGDTVFAGFTASTGGRRMTVELLESSFTFTLNGPPPPPASSTGSPTSSKSSNKKAVGLGVGLTFGILALIAIVGGVVFFIRKRGGLSSNSFKRGLGGEDSLSTTHASLNKL